MEAMQIYTLHWISTHTPCIRMRSSHPAPSFQRNNHSCTNSSGIQPYTKHEPRSPYPPTPHNKPILIHPSKCASSSTCTFRSNSMLIFKLGSFSLALVASRPPALPASPMSSFASFLGITPLPPLPLRPPRVPVGSTSSTEPVSLWLSLSRTVVGLGEC